MKEELSKIEVGCVDQLKQLKDEQDVLEGRIKAMDEMKASVAESVYLRVRSDYVAKRDALEAQAKPLRAETREQYAKLAALMESLEAELERITLDGQEIELRHQLGEYDKKEYDKRTKAIEAADRGQGRVAQGGRGAQGALPGRGALRAGTAGECAATGDRQLRHRRDRGAGQAPGHHQRIRRARLRPHAAGRRRPPRRRSLPAAPW